jgi:hypothetical protein
MSRIVVDDLENTMGDVSNGSTQVFSKSDGSGYEGMYMKRGNSSEKLVGNPAVDTQGIIRYNAQTISETTTIPTNINAFSAGPLTIDSGATITIGSGSYWTII